MTTRPNEYYRTVVTTELVGTMCVQDFLNPYTQKKIEFPADETVTSFLRKYGSITIKVAPFLWGDPVDGSTYLTTYQLPGDGGVSEQHYFINDREVTLKEAAMVWGCLQPAYPDKLTKYDFIDLNEVKRILNRVQTESLLPALKN